jgi:hypothetical protein
MMSVESIKGLYDSLTVLAENGFGISKDKLKLVNYFLIAGSNSDGSMTENEAVGFADGLTEMVANGFSSLKDELAVVNYILGRGK